MLELFIEYLAFEKRFSKHTVKSYEIDLSQFSDYINKEYDIEFLEVKPEIVRSWVVYLLDKGIKERTVNRKISSLKSFYRFLIQQNYLVNSPLSQISILKTSKRLPSYIRQSEIDKLISEDFFEDSFKGVRDKCIVFILFSTGIRLSELINIKTSDISNGVVRVLGKRNKERDVPVSTNLINLIDCYISLREGVVKENCAFLLVTNKGDKLYEKFVFRTVKHYLGLVTTQKEKSPHVLRHTFATQMLNNGADLNAIKELLGHVDLTATQVYTHNSIEKLKGIYKQAHPRSENKN
jgi:integrase/recombinase XerC